MGIVKVFSKNLRILLLDIVMQLKKECNVVFVYRLLYIFDKMLCISNRITDMHKSQSIGAYVVNYINKDKIITTMIA